MRRAVNRFFQAFLAVPNRAEFSANAIALSAVHIMANVVQRCGQRIRAIAFENWSEPESPRIEVATSVESCDA